MSSSPQADDSRPGVEQYRRLAWGRVVVLLGVVTTAALTGWWAGRETLEPPDDPLAVEAEPLRYEVVEGTVGRSLSFVAVAEWQTTPMARAQAAGVVTSVEVAAGDKVETGDVLFTVNLRPVVAAAGDVPAFRDLRVGDEGQDVVQLQRMLITLGFLSAEPDGRFGTTTAAAVQDWQQSLSVADDGVIRLGDIVFLPELPTRVRLGEAVAVGNRLSGEEQAVLSLSDAPAFWIPLTPEQRNLVPLDSSVLVSHGAGSWEARTVEATEETASGGGTAELRLMLEAASGGPVCGDACADWVQLEGRTDFPAEVVVVPETAGPVVPVAAISTNPGGETIVTLENGETVGVEVVASYAGQAVVDGVEVGDVLLLPFTDVE